MKLRILFISLFLNAIIFSYKLKTSENLEEMAQHFLRPEAVLVKTVKLEPSTSYLELISNGRVISTEDPVVPLKVNGIIYNRRTV